MCRRVCGLYMHVWMWMWRRTYVIAVCCHCCRLLLLLLITRRLVNIVNIVKSSTRTNTAANEQIWPQWKHSVHRKSCAYAILVYVQSHTRRTHVHLHIHAYIYKGCYSLNIEANTATQQHSTYFMANWKHFACMCEQSIVWYWTARLSSIQWRCLFGIYFFQYY